MNLNPLPAIVAATADALARPFLAIGPDGKEFRFATAAARREFLAASPSSRPHFA